MFHFTGLLGGPTIYYTEYEDVMSKPGEARTVPRCSPHAADRHGGVRTVRSDMSMAFAR